MSMAFDLQRYGLAAPDLRRVGLHYREGNHTPRFEFPYDSLGERVMQDWRLQFVPDSGPASPAKSDHKCEMVSARVGQQASLRESRTS
jgi:hypothetical protein